MKKLILVAVVSVALLFVGCKSENSNEVSRNTNKVETTATTTTTNSKSERLHLYEKSEKEFRADLGNPKVDEDAKINYVSANAKKKIKAVNLTKKSILIDHVMVLSGISSKPNLLCFYIEDYNKYYGVSDFREINNSDTYNYYCKITDDSGRKAYIFFEKIDKDIVMEWSALFLDKNDKPIKFDDDYFDQDINDLKYVNDLDK
jgi:outer membrane murein-binding lipoprotein Lpp